MRDTTDAGEAAWPEIGDIVVNHGGGEPDPTDRLNDMTLTFTTDAGPLELIFADGRLSWSEAMRSFEAPFKAYEVRPDILFVDVQFVDGPVSLTLILDLAEGRALLIEVTAPAPDLPDTVLERVTLRGSQNAVAITYREAFLPRDASHVPFARSATLLGQQFRYRYSETHLYDHFYLSDRYYAWFCRKGPDAGLGDFEECDHFSIAPNLVLVCWGEKLLPCAGITLEDHETMRTVGKIFGADSRSGQTASSIVGAAISKIADIDPGS